MFLRFDEFLNEKLTGIEAVKARQKSLNDRLERAVNSLKNATDAGKKNHVVLYKEKVKYYKELIAANNLRFNIEKIKDNIKTSM